MKRVQLFLSAFGCTIWLVHLLQQFHQHVSLVSPQQISWDHQHSWLHLKALLWTDNFFSVCPVSLSAPSWSCSKFLPQERGFSLRLLLISGVKLSVFCNRMLDVSLRGPRCSRVFRPPGFLRSREASGVPADRVVYLVGQKPVWIKALEDRLPTILHLTCNILDIRKVEWFNSMNVCLRRPSVQSLILPVRCRNTP